MKKNWLYALIFIILIFLFWIHSGKQTFAPEQKGVLQTNKFESNYSSNHSNKPIASNATGLDQNTPEKWEERFRQSVERQNSSISFYGKVIDQNSNPISGVEIIATVRQWYVKSEVLDAGAHFITIKKETDAEGRFEINGETGDGFGVGITKDGYLVSPKASRGFGPIAGSSENPVVFKMWKKGESAKLVSYRKLLGFQPDGRVYTIDLLNGKKIENGDVQGDLRVKFQRPPIEPNKVYSWTLEISAIGGGLVETTDETPYLAPENGYQSQILLQTNSVSPSAMPNIIKDYYITTRNSQNYGIIHLEIYSDYRGQSAILIDSKINPNGSRNLQP